MAPLRNCLSLTYIKEIHHRVPRRIRSLYAPLTWIYRQLRSIYGKVYPPVFVLEGDAQTNSQPFTFAYVGSYFTAEKAYWIQRALLPGFREHFMGRHWFWTVARLLQNSRFDCVMVLIESGVFTLKSFSRNCNFKIPRWIEMEIDISQAMKELQRRSKKSDFGCTQRLIRKYNLDFEITRDPARFHNFYYNMYLPYLKKRYGKKAILSDYSSIRKIYSRLELLLIKKEKNILAGGLIEYYRKKGSLVILGVKDGNQEYVRYGVIGALYYYSIIHIQKKGYKRINLTGTYPILNDGLTSYKMSLGGEIIPNYNAPKGYLRLILLKNSIALSEFLIRNPFVYYPKNHEPFRSIFLNSNQCATKKEFKKVFNSSNCKGLRGTHLFIFGEKEKILEWADSLSLSQLSIQSAEDCFIENNDR